MSKKILYMSCHEILEYDELKLFTELGYECYSLGAYTQPGGEEHRKRPALKLPYDPHFIELSLQYDRRYLHEEQLNGIDIVIVMHEPSFIKDNWPLFKKLIDRGGRVIWRSIGQSIPHVENLLKPWRDEGLEIVRYSPAEETIQGNVGQDAMIRFYKDPEEYKGWTGERRQIINFTQSLKERGRFTGYEVIRRIFDGLPAKVYGPGNEDLGIMGGGLLKYDEQIELMQQSRAYLYHGTYPASYTLSFIEAMMVGIPILAVGRKHGNGDMFPMQETYEIDAIIDSGINGYVSDDPKSLQAYAQGLLGNESKARALSTFGRAKAIELFGKSKIKAEWEAFLGGR